MRTRSQSAINSILGWLARAQDHGTDDGFASHYHRISGWSPSYPEVTGYLIQTLFRYAQENNESMLRMRLLRAADWLMSIQMSNGAFQGRLIGDKPVTPVVFNTGMIVFGLVDAYRASKQAKYLDAAVRAADWLVSVQDPDGAWRKFLTLNGTGEAHIYKTKVTRALLEMHKETGNGRYKEAAKNNLAWSLRQQESSGWFRYNALRCEENHMPLLHFVAYTIEGILDSGLYLEDDRLIRSAYRAAAGLLASQNQHGGLFALYGSRWEPKSHWRCPVGCAQTAIIYMRLHEMYPLEGFSDGASRSLDYVSSLIVTGGENDGGIPGSDPISGSYMPDCYLSWAAKFYLDALLLEKKSKLLAGGV